MRDLKEYLGEQVRIEIERPLGFVHDGTKYLCNYGFIPDTVSGDGEEVDVYVLGISQVLALGSMYPVKIIGMVIRMNDVEDKLIGVPIDCKTKYDSLSVKELLSFREHKYIHEIYLEA